MQINGIVPVMLTPFHEDGRVDYGSLERLTEWYIARGADALFAVCQSSEMQFLTLPERVEMARFVVRIASGRLPVVASGHISTSLDDQKAELAAIAATGVDGIVLVTNRLDPENKGTETFRAHLKALLGALPADLPGVELAPHRKVGADCGAHGAQPADQGRGARPCREEGALQTWQGAQRDAELSGTIGSDGKGGQLAALFICPPCG